MKRKVNLKRIVNESIRKVLNEGSTSQDLYNQWLDIQEAIGAEAFLDNIWNWLDSDELERIVQNAIMDDIIPDPEEDYEEWD